MRLFLAIDLPAKVKQQIENQLTPIKKEYPQCSWVSQENYHITLYFFGEIDKVDRIKERLRDLVFDQKPFHLYSRAMSLFINEKILIYLNFRREKRLEELADIILKNFNHGSGRERKFVPHLTVARCKIPSKQQYFVLKKRLEKLIVDADFKIEKIILFESVLGGKKPVYKEIGRFRLQ